MRGTIRVGTSADSPARTLEWLDADGGSRGPATLAGLQLADDEASRTALAEQFAAWSGPGLAISPAGPADRWGRTPVMVTQGTQLLNAALLAAGLASFRPGELSAACARLLAREEDRARARRLGAWQGSFVVHDAARPETLDGSIGRFALVEGRVADIGETRSRVYLNFGAVRSEDFTIVIQKRNLRKFEASGMRWTSLEGRRIRVRGVVVESGGPLVEVSSPEDIERLD